MNSDYPLHRSLLAQTLDDCRCKLRADPPHLGNLVGSMLPADAYARYLRLKGEDVLSRAWVTTWPAVAASVSGEPVDLPEPDTRRDGSGVSGPVAASHPSRSR